MGFEPNLEANKRHVLDEPIDKDARVYISLDLMEPRLVYLRTDPEEVVFWLMCKPFLVDRHRVGERDALEGTVQDGKADLPVLAEALTDHGWLGLRAVTRYFYGRLRNRAERRSPCRNVVVAEWFRSGVKVTG